MILLGYAVQSGLQLFTAHGRTEWVRVAEAVEWGSNQTPRPVSPITGVVVLVWLAVMVLYWWSIWEGGRRRYPSNV